MGQGYKYQATNAATDFYRFF
uniref:Uncharacterized protein n=1 Tax=Rhizophora mucronata TaxID=61149 RepID=A0A2P2P4C2_RHIMU